MRRRVDFHDESRRAAKAIAVLLLIHAAAGPMLAEEDAKTAKSREQRLVEERFELMRSRVAAAEVECQEPDFPKKFELKPIFRYSDPARGAIASSLWKLGSEGRPKALLAMELHRTSLQRPCVMYEYSSLTTTPFLVTASDIHWSPRSTLYEFKTLPEMRPPEKTAPRRLMQMREAAHRFEGTEVVNNEKCELRLLPHPIDRYRPEKADYSDGAIFLFAFGTNPEVVLMIESDGTEWTYSLGRMTGAESVIMTLDGKPAWQGAPLEKGPNSSYTGSVTVIAIPGFTADGAELNE